MREPFVVVAGSPRSGTSLLRTILRRSDALVVHRTEPHYLLELHRRFGRTIRDLPRAIDFLSGHEKFPSAEIDVDALRREFAGRTSADLSDLLRAAYRLLRGDRAGTPLVLKHPAFILHLDLIRELFPDLRVIHLIRDPRANAFSQRTRWPSTSMWMSAQGWQASVDAGRRWQQRGVTPYLEARYEDLITAPEETCQAICRFLEIPFERSLLEFDHVEKEWNPSAPGEGTRRHYDGFERQRIEKWRTFMKPVEVRLIENRCRAGMELFGYALTNPQVPLTEYLPYYLRERRRAWQKSLRRMRRRRREAATIS